MRPPIMYFKRLIFIVFLFFAIIPNIIFGQVATPTDSLAKLLINKEADMFHNILTGDKASADKMIGNDYITINADGVMQNKIEMMKTFGKFKGATAKLFDKRIRIYGNLSIITGRAKFYLKSILVADVFYTETWVYRDNRFYFIGWQGTMTGLPSYYPLTLAALGLIILYIVFSIIKKRIRRSRVTAV